MDRRIALYGVLTILPASWEFFASGGELNMKNGPGFLLRFLVLFLSAQRHRRIALAMSLLAFTYQKALRSPSLWDSDVWSIHTDVVMSIWLLVGGDTTAETLCRTIRDQFAWFYFAAAFWKLNSHFWNPTGSCATTFVVQIIAQYIAPLVSYDTLVELARFGKAVAPAVTLVVELSVGGLMLSGVLLGSRAGERAGVVLALLFHLAVCLVPQPNDISGFALSCASRLIVFASEDGTVIALSQLRGLMLPLTASATVVVAIGLKYPFTPNNWAFALYVPLCAFILSAVVFGEKATKTAEGNVKSPQKKLRTRWTYLASAISFFYAYGGLVLGLQEEGTPNMFANLKVHGGSNHFLLPTGLLLHFFGDKGDTHPFGGGVVRIEETTSRWMSYVYPADLTPILMPPNVADLLVDVGNTRPLFFNPGASRILYGMTPEPEVFYKYTVPALELKRLLREAKRNDRDFTLTYSQLPGTKGDEIWRATATKRKFFVEAKGGQITKCRVSVPPSKRITPCDATDLPMLPDDAVPGVITALSMYHAYPIVTNKTDELPPSIVCFGP